MMTSHTFREPLAPCYLGQLLIANCPSLSLLTFSICSPTVNSVDKQRETGALLIAATLVAAIRLRGEPIDNSLKVQGAIADSIRLARLVLSRLERD